MGLVGLQTQGEFAVDCVTIFAILDSNENGGI